MGKELVQENCIALTGYGRIEIQELRPLKIEKC
jgi:hypothetical protein